MTTEPPSPSRGTDNASAPGLPEASRPETSLPGSGTTITTLFLDWTSVSGLAGSVRLLAVSSWSPGGSGRSGITTQSPRLSALVRPTVSPLSETTTSEPGSALPATTVSPDGLTRTTSMLGVFSGSLSVSSDVALSVAFGGVETCVSFGPAGGTVEVSCSVRGAVGGTGTTSVATDGSLPAS